MIYRKEIDGLRALAILPVLLFHVGFPYLSGGFLGVDVFFVISGFLITKIIVDEINEKRFSLVNFYERRARRILPALVTIIIATSIFLPLFSTHPKVLNSFGESVISVTLFASNIYFWLTSGYFGSTSELSPLLHTWSLAVEEQFYIVFPLLAMFLLPISRRVFYYCIILIIIVSLLISEWGASNSPIGNFYLIPSRAWELMFGSVAAIIVDRRYITCINENVKALLAFIGLVLILCSYFFFSEITPHPSVLTIPAVFGTTLVLLFAKNRCIVGRCLSFQPMVFIGLISYSLYLWHQPIFAIAKLYTSIHLALYTQIALIFVVILLSYLTWKYIENPFRNKKRYDRGQIFILSAKALVICSILGFVFKENLTLQKWVYPTDIKRYETLLSADNDHTAQMIYKDECKLWSQEFNDNFVTNFDACSKVYKSAIFILGGSHGIDLYNAIAMNTSNKFVVSVSRGFCRAHDDIDDDSATRQCQYKDFLSFVSKRSKHISTLIYTQTPDRLIYGKMDEATISNVSRTHVSQVVEYLERVKSENDINVVMLGMLPPLTKSPIRLDYRQNLLEQLNSNISTNTLKLTHYLDKTFTEKLNKVDIKYITKMEGFQLDLSRDLIIDGQITYSDKRHLSAAGERSFGRRLVNYMYQLGYSDFTPVN